MKISAEFRKITAIPLIERQTNRLADGVARKDMSFEQLTYLFFFNRPKFGVLKKSIRLWLKKEPSETILALAGYIYYIAEDFKKAKKYFFDCVRLNPDNLDNWIDLAFSLRHSGENRVSSAILFHHDYVMYYYKYLNLSECGFVKFRKMALEVNRRANAV